MTLAVDIAGDFVNVVDNLEAVTLRPPVDENANAELITNGRFDETTTGWVGGGVSWDERMALVDLPSEYVSQAITTVVGQVYLVAMEVFAWWSSTAPMVRIGTAVDGAQVTSETISESGRLLLTFTATATTTYITLRNGDGRSRMANVSVKLKADTAITNALCRAVTTREAATSKGEYRTGDVKWHLPASEATTAPTLGSIIYASGTTAESAIGWKVLTVEKQTFRNRWRCWCRLLEVADVPLGYMTIKKLEPSISAQGAEKRTPIYWAKNIRAKVQQQSSAREVFNDHRHTPERVTIYTKHQLPIDDRFQFIGADGKTYKVQGYANPAQIDGLFAIEAEVNPWALN